VRARNKQLLRVSFLLSRPAQQLRHPSVLFGKLVVVVAGATVAPVECRSAGSRFLMVLTR